MDDKDWNMHIQWCNGRWVRHTRLKIFAIIIIMNIMRAWPWCLSFSPATRWRESFRPGSGDKTNLRTSNKGYFRTPVMYGAAVISRLPLPLLVVSYSRSVSFRRRHAIRTNQKKLRSTSCPLSNALYQMNHSIVLYFILFNFQYVAVLGLFGKILRWKSN